MNNLNVKDKNLMQTFSDTEIVRFSDRLKEAIGSQSNRSFAEKSGLSEAMIRKYVTGRALPSLESLDKLSIASGKPISWLTEGYGTDIFLGEAKSDNQKVRSQFAITTEYDSRTHIVVPELNIKVAAGNGTYPLSEEQIGQFVLSKYWLAKEGLSNANLYLFHVVGDSMESTINDGDIILADVKNEGWTGALNGVFIILVNDLLMVKRIQYDMMKNGFHIKSDNSLYESYFVKFDEGLTFKVIAKVERILTKMRHLKTL